MLTPAQQAAFFCALPFLALSCAWIIVLSFLVPKPRHVPVKVEKKRRTQ